MTADQIAKANAGLRNQPPLEIVKWAIAQAKGRAVVSTNFRPYEAVILHLCVQVQPDIPVLWVDHGYNRPATYQHAGQLKKLLKLNLKPFLPRITAAHRDAIFGPLPSPDDEASLKQFSALMKLEPFQRGMKELAPTVWITALAESPEPQSRGTGHRFRGQKFRRVEGQPRVLLEDADMENYLKLHRLPNEWDYFDPAKADDKRECGLHAAWGGKAIRSGV